MARARRRTVELIISCEHASNRLPARYGDLGLSRDTLETHVAWDPGARRVARYCARRLAGCYHEGRYSRLLIDLNRSPHNPKLIPTKSFGVSIPGNIGLTSVERHHRLRHYYLPYRDAVLRDIRRGLTRREICAHVSVHSFTPRLGRRTRRADIGVLYDPARVPERELALGLVDALSVQGLRVRRNYPYRGTSDGLTTYCRRIFPEDTYLGIELEINQKLLGSRDRGGDLPRAIATGIEAALRAVAERRLPENASQAVE
jgi:predicted N-formylglutamate amidohydrolase